MRACPRRGGVLASDNNLDRVALGRVPEGVWKHSSNWSRRMVRRHGLGVQAAGAEPCSGRLPAVVGHIHVQKSTWCSAAAQRRNAVHAGVRDVAVGANNLGAGLEGLPRNAEPRWRRLRPGRLGERAPVFDEVGSAALTLSVAAQGLVHAVLVKSAVMTLPQRLAVIIAPRPTGPHRPTATVSRGLRLVEYPSQNRWVAASKDVLVGRNQVDRGLRGNTHVLSHRTIM